jgi:peptidyl-dipeptidase Dcp
VKAAARQEAAERDMDGWVFTLAYPSFGPFITFADNRDLREQMWRAYNSRGNRGNENDNNEINREMTLLRYQQAKLLGYSNYSEYVLSNRMCETPAQLSKFFDQLLDASMPYAIQDLKDVSNYASRHGAKLPLQRWDFSYWSEKMKQDKYDFDEELLRPYFQLENVRQGIFNLYGRLYGLTFKEAHDIDIYHPDVKVYEVYDGNRFMAVLYLDMHPRASKRSGAWMTEFRNQSNIDGNEVRPLIQVVCNFSKPVGDKPALLSFDEVETFMHEFGHAMHGMLSDCTYPGVSGTSVKRDFVELPSQVMENWCYEPEFLNTFARHYQTGATIPMEYIQKIRAAEKYLAGWLCVRQLSLGLVDFAFHTITEPIEGPIEVFERAHMKELLPAVQGTNTSTAFTHIFAGGYASGYYGYKWAEVLDADVFSKFKQNGIFDKTTAEAFRNEVLSKGGTEHPAVLFRNFMGRDPKIDALLQRCGFNN